MLLALSTSPVFSTSGMVKSQDGGLPEATTDDDDEDVSSEGDENIGGASESRI